MCACVAGRRLITRHGAGTAAGGHRVEHRTSQRADRSESVFPHAGSGQQQGADRHGAQGQGAGFDPRRGGREGGTGHKKASWRQALRD